MGGVPSFFMIQKILHPVGLHHCVDKKYSSVWGSIIFMIKNTPVDEAASFFMIKIP